LAIQETNKWQPGWSKTVLVFGQGENARAVISPIGAHIHEISSEERLVIRGPVSFASKTLKHINEVILPLIDHILNSINQPLKAF